MADKKKPAEKKDSYNRRDHYKVEGEKVARARRDCPRCGPGTFLAEHKDRAACGRCGYTERKAAPEGAEKKGEKKPKQQAPAA